MNFRTTYILFGTLVGLIALAALLLLTGPKPGDEGLVFAEARAANRAATEFDRLTIDRKRPGEEPLVFARTGPRAWRLEKPYSARVDSAVVESLVGQLLNLRKDPAADALKGGPTALGLEPPAVAVTLSASGGGSDTLALTLGGVSFGGDPVVYAATADDPKTPFAVKRSSLAGLFKLDAAADGATAADLVKPLADFRSRDLLLADAGFNPAEQADAVAASEGGKSFALARDKSGTWAFTAPAGFGPAEVDGDAAGAGSEVNPPTGVKPLLTALAGLKPASAADVIENPANLAEYGLEPGKEAGPKFTVTRKPTDGGSSVTETLIIGKPEDKTGKRFARLEGERAVVKLSAAAVEPLVKLVERPAGLRDRTLLAFAPVGCDAVDVLLPGATAPIELRKLGNPADWKMLAPDGSPRAANGQAVQSLLAAFGGRLVKEFPEPGLTEAALGFDKPTAELTLWQNGIIADPPKPEEKKDDKKPEEKKPEPPTKPKLREPAAKLVFGKRERDVIYVRRIVGTTKTDLAIPDVVLPRVAKGRLDYIDVTLPSFARHQAAKLSIVRGADTVLVERQPKSDDAGDDLWQIKQPTALDGRPAGPAAVVAAVGTLAGLRPVKLIAEKATDAELEAWGLKSPRLRATVTLDDKDKGEAREYLFGGDAPDNAGVFCKLGNGDLVFTASPDVLKAFAPAEWQNPKLLAIDPAKVTGMKLTGWKDVVGTVTTHDLIRANPTAWSTPGGTGDAPADRCERFLQVVLALRAERFAAHKTGPTDAMKLTVPAGALQVELRITGAEPVTVLIGGEGDDKALLYATVGTLPGDVALVSRKVLEDAKARPGYFVGDPKPAGTPPGNPPATPPPAPPPS